MRVQFSKHHNTHGHGPLLPWRMLEADAGMKTLRSCCWEQVLNTFTN